MPWVHAGCTTGTLQHSEDCDRPATACATQHSPSWCVGGMVVPQLLLLLLLLSAPLLLLVMCIVSGSLSCPCGSCSAEGNTTCCSCCGDCCSCCSWSSWCCCCWRCAAKWRLATRLYTRAG
jgi:hypothetical protein